MRTMACVHELTHPDTGERVCEMTRRPCIGSGLCMECEDEEEDDDGNC